MTSYCRLISDRFVVQQQSSSSSSMLLKNPVVTVFRSPYVRGGPCRLQSTTSTSTSSTHSSKRYGNKLSSSTAATAASLRRKAIKVTGAPPSISAVKDEGYRNPDDGVFIRAVGSTRHVMLANSSLTGPELEGLAYRMTALTKNEALSSILISSLDTEDNPFALPASLQDRDYPRVVDPLFDFVDPGLEPSPNASWYVSSGYDVLGEIYTKGIYKQYDTVYDYLGYLAQLSLAIRGNVRKSKIPVITIPHGAITDGGFAFCVGSYVLATADTSYQILNPSRGLSFDPVGLSYLLPRIGKEFKQPNAIRYATSIANLLALTGYQADAMDLIETGLVTHYTDSSRIVGLLEMTLGQLPGWQYQTIVKNPTRYYGETENAAMQRDPNAGFRNVSVAAAIHAITAFPANSQADLWTLNDADHTIIQYDPSLITDPADWHHERSSNLLTLAATFDPIFQQERSVEGIYERFKEIAAKGKSSKNRDDVEITTVAQEIVQRMSKASPLALSVVYQLLQKGKNEMETYESCIERERKVQAKLYTLSPDYTTWAQQNQQQQQQQKTKSSNEPVRIKNWKHKSFRDVTNNEVAEILGA